MISVPALELHCRAAVGVEAHYRVNGPNTGRNSGGKWIIKKTVLVGGVWSGGLNVHSMTCACSRRPTHVQL